MNINLIKIRSVLHQNSEQLDKESSNFVEDINNELMDEDILLCENAKDSNFDVVLVETGGTETLFKDMLDHLRQPVIVISTGKNNSFAASLEIKTYCAMKKVICFFLAGLAHQIAGAIGQISRILNAYFSVKDTNLGVVGKPSDWLICYDKTNDEFKEKFNINLIDISMEEFYEEIEKKELVDDIPHFKKLQSKYKDKESLMDALYIYSALKRLSFKYNLKGLTVRCFDLLEKYKNTSCLALALLNEEGIVSACEGDIPTLVTMYLLYSLTGMPSFQVNPSNIDFDSKSMIFAHCTLPLNMVSKYDLMTHFESGLGVAIKGELQKGKVTICKINPNLVLEDTLCIPGEIVENLSLPGFCRTQIRVSFNQDALFNFLDIDFGNHIVLTYADASALLTLVHFIKDMNEKKQ